MRKNDVGRAATLMEVLHLRAAHQATRPAFVFLEEPKPREWTYGELDSNARSVAGRLCAAGKPGTRVALFFPPGLDYVAAFLGCLYAGMVAVPLYPPRARKKSLGMAKPLHDCGARIALTLAKNRDEIEIFMKFTGLAERVAVLAVDGRLDSITEFPWSPEKARLEDLAFLQYTSGSTGSPKGVMVSHANLMANMRMIAEGFQSVPEDIGLNWLPFYHDMGLIGTVLQALYRGIVSILMPPVAFIKDPLCWLEAITRFGATVCGGPNFAYDLCVRKARDDRMEGLDLRTWRLAFNGAEPVSAETMRRFAKRFEAVGFRAEAFYPCYGMAETTLMVSGGLPKEPPVTVGLDEDAFGRGLALAATAGDRIREMVGCGHVLSGGTVRIVDPKSQTPVEDGAIGEIWVQGPHVTRGYWNRPEENLRAFAVLGDGREPYFRTGDLGFFRGGELFVSGRLKDILIIRGRNHYPQDIEATVARSHAALRAGCCAAFTVNRDGTERVAVVQEITRSALRKLNPREVAEAIRAAVTEVHQLRVHEVALIKPGSLPKTSSGKVRRFACRKALLAGTLALVSKPKSEETADKPGPAYSANERMALLLGLIAEILKMPIEEVRASRSPAELGMDSVAAAELQHRLEKAFGVSPSLTDFLEGKSIAELAATCTERPAKSTPKARPTLSENVFFPLTPNQKALWFLQALAPESSAYNLFFAVRVKAELDPERLRQVFGILAKRHPAMRLEFQVRDDEPMQRIREEADLPFRVQDASAWDRDRLDTYLANEAHRPFRLEEDPLLRLEVLSRSTREHLLLLVAHHIAMDFGSLLVLMDEAGTLLGKPAARLKPLTRGYADHVFDLANHLAGAQGGRLRDYWQQRLKPPLPVLDLPLDRPRPEIQRYHGAAFGFDIDGQTAAGLRAMAAGHGATLYALVLAGFQALLYRYSGQETLLVGSPAGGRTHPLDEGVVGYFVNPIVIRGELAPTQSFGEVLAQTRQRVLGALAHQELPFQQLVEQLHPERDPGRSPIFQVMFTLLRPSRLPEAAPFALGTAGAAMTLGDLRLESYPISHKVSQLDLTLLVVDGGGDLHASLEYNTDLFEARTIERMAGALRQLLAAVVADGDRPLCELPLMDGSERERLLSTWNDTAREVSCSRGIHEMVAFHAGCRGDGMGVVHRDIQLTYAELDRSARALETALRLRGVGPGALVGICLERSAWLPAALLGVLRTGAAYLPLDPTFPPDRLELLIADAGPALVLTQAGANRNLPGHESLLLEEVDVGRGGLAPVPFQPERPAYVMYTSGSTGKPKGTLITGANLIHFFAAMDTVLDTDARSLAGTWLAVTNLTFDISVLELLWTLTRGFKLVVQDTAQGALFTAGKDRRFGGKDMAFSLFYFADEEGDRGDKYRLLMDGARFADKHGFVAVWTPERHFHSFGGLYPNPSVAGAAVAAITQHVQVRAGSVVLPLHDPVRVAEEWSLVDNLSGGRAGISVASGWNARDFVFKPDHFSKNKEIMFAQLEVVRQLWRGQTIRRTGGDGREVEIGIRPRPLQSELPVWVTAAGSPDTFTMAGKLGANVLTHLLGQSLEELAGKITAYRRAWHEHGHTGEGWVSLMLHTYVGEDMATVREVVHQPFRNYLNRSLGLMKGLARSLGLDMDSEHFTEDARETLLHHAFERYFETGALFGTVDRCLALVDSLKGIGVDEVACLIDFGVDHETTMAGLDRLNALRQRAAAQSSATSEDVSFPFHMRAHAVTHLQTTPTLARMLVENADARASLDRLRHWLIGGEALPPSLLEAVQPLTSARITNMYGPTETTIWSTCKPLRDHRITIGRPLANTRAYVVDPWLEPRPVGLPGELLLGGAGLATGYVNRPVPTTLAFIPDPFGTDPRGSRLYRTGDLARFLPNGEIAFLGRRDHQIKLRGHRIEPGEIEKALTAHPDVSQAAVTVRDDSLVAHLAASTEDVAAYRGFLQKTLPEYMVPARFLFYETLPLTPNGKVDRVLLAAHSPQPAVGDAPAPDALPRTDLEKRIAAVWREVLKLDKVGIDDSFFDLGGHSLRLAQAHRKLQESMGLELSMVDLFRFPTIRGLAAHLAGRGRISPEPEVRERAAVAEAPTVAPADRDVAIIGMACRFPGAGNIDRFWQNLYDGTESITRFNDDELLASGVHASLLGNPQYVKAGAILEDIEGFDAAFFGFSPREAALLDPQHRLFLECAWEALEHAACDPGRYEGRIGVFAGSGMNTYLLNNLYSHRARFADDSFQLMIANDKDFLPSRTSHAFNLTGPAISVQTGCSTSLVALVLARESLLGRQCEMALAGAASVRVPQKEGYFFQEGMIASPDGHCRAFDAAARGTLFGSGAGVVVLKPLTAAMTEGDIIHAVIKGAAINNDGSDKVSYTAPGVSGQVAVIDRALAAAGVPAETIDYVEAHGTGTELGDPIEVEALTLAFGKHTTAKGFCAIGSVKSNFGHLDTAAGAAGLIKTVLALQKRQIPPSLFFEEPNPEIDFENSPFFVNTALSEWPDRGRPRRAGVSSFGIGGTNAHVILEEAPATDSEREPAREYHPLLVSAGTREALDQVCARLADHWEAHPQLSLAVVCHTLQMGRKRFDFRASAAVANRIEALTKLRDPSQLFIHYQEHQAAPVVFMFPGGGAQYVDMGRGLYHGEADFREAFDRCAAILAPHLEGHLRDWLYSEESRDAAAKRIKETQLALPALFTVEYAVSQLLMSWGIQPEAMIGHSMGEYVAACLAGVFSLEDGLAMVVERGRLFELLPRGGMVSVPLPADRVRDLIREDLSFAAINSPAESVVSGPLPELETFCERLRQYKIEFRRLQIHVAAHSSMVDALVPEFTEFIAQRELQPPRIPFVSNVTGSWITPEQATDPAYWGRQLRETVRFGEGVALLAAEPDYLFLELGPGRTLTTLAKQQTDRSRIILPSMRHPYDQFEDEAFLMDTLGKLWAGGAAIDWARFHGAHVPRRALLPTYPFQRRRCWIDPVSESATVRPQGKNPFIEDWFYTPVWRETALPWIFDSRTKPDKEHEDRVLLFDDGRLGLEMAVRLVESGRDVIRVQPGDRFCPGPPFTVRPERHEDYQALFEALDKDGQMPQSIIHLWSLGDDEDGERARNRGYYSLMGLARALAEKESAGMNLWVVGSGLHAVESKDPLHPDRATLLGPCVVMPQEIENLSCRLVDLAPTERSPLFEVTASLLLSEWLQPGEDRAIAYRNGRRWVLDYEPMPLPREAPAMWPLREGGVYLITGGLGGVGSLLAEYLAREYRAKLILVGRSGLPEPRAAENLDPDHPLVQKMRAHRRWREWGAEVEVLRADVSQIESFQAVVDRARARFGALHGIIHAAGLAGLETVKTIDQIDREDSERHFQAKVHGTRNLSRVLGEDEPDFVLLISSNVTVLGGLGAAAYTAANAFLDAYALKMRARGHRWISAAWDGWLTEPSEAETRAFQTSIDQYAMRPEESVEAFRRVVTSALVPRVVVSSGDLGARLRQWVLGREEDKEQGPSQVRPRLTTEFVAPENELQERIVRVWREALGIDELGIADNFFDLGGNSLIALKVIARLKSELGRDIPVVALFEGPTVRALAEVLSTPADRPAHVGSNRGERRRARRRKRKLEVRS